MQPNVLCRPVFHFHTTVHTVCTYTIQHGTVHYLLPKMALLEWQLWQISR